jgi:3-deoxy-D-manno-octulosonic-acid transferase
LSIVASLFNKKIRTGIIGRIKTKSILNKFLNTIDRSKPIYWFHAASHGEYEQVRPVLKGLKEIEPDSVAIVSFFSPSGLLNVTDDRIDCAVYLPFDFYFSMKRILENVAPTKIIFAAYDTWPNFIWAANKLGINTTIFAATFEYHSKKMYPVIRDFYKTVYDEFSAIYTVSQNDYTRIKNLIFHNNDSKIRVLGNPRYDQVKNKADKFTKNRTISVLIREKRIIAGSIWPEDEKNIFDPIIQLLNKDPEISVIWVPHEPTERYIKSSVRQFENAGFEPILVASENDTRLDNGRVYIVTIVGILSKLYWQGQIAYVGGGFTSGVHNVMEPAIARLPVLFGPKYSKSHEAGELIRSGGGYTLRNGVEAYEILDKLLNDKNYFLNASYAATQVIHDNIGSSTRVVRGIIRD